MFRKIFLIILLSNFSLLTFASNETEKLLKELDDHLSKKEKFHDIKKERIRNLTTDLNYKLNSNELNSAFDICISLLDENESFSYDSAFKYVSKLNSIALKLKDPEKISLSGIKMGFTLLSSGMFKESLDTLKSLNSRYMNENLKKEFYNVIARTYYDLADYDNDEYFSEYYRKIGNQYLYS